MSGEKKCQKQKTSSERVFGKTDFRNSRRGALSMNIFFRLHHKTLRSSQIANVLAFCMKASYGTDRDTRTDASIDNSPLAPGRPRAKNSAPTNKQN